MNHEKHYYVYILTNPSRTLYTGITNNLRRRIDEHKRKLVSGFTARYNIDLSILKSSKTCVMRLTARRKSNPGRELSEWR